MNPSVLDISEKNNVLKFTISNINVSMANAIRRVIIADIPTVVFRTAPHNENQVVFNINTSRLNNEILKQRLSCIPIYLNALDSLIKDYSAEIDIKNDTDTLIYVTTADFKIKSKTTDKYLSNEAVKSIFPPDPISNQYIDICRLRPKLSDNLPGEHLKITCNFNIGTASENGSFNVVSTCSYANTPDLFKISQAKEEKLLDLKSKYDDETEITYQITDWMNLDAKRITIPDSFNFKIETIGVFKNVEIVLNAVNIIIQRLKKIIDIYSKPNSLIINSTATIANAFDINLEEEDYTIGKILEYILYETYYNNQKTLSFCGFRKPHPHINLSIIRLAFETTADKNTVIEYIVNASNIAIKYFENLLPSFGQMHPDELVALNSTIPQTISVKSQNTAIPEPEPESEIPVFVPGTSEEIEVEKTAS
jgi:DNA-directed RNA polymerase alpha subunit